MQVREGPVIPVRFKSEVDQHLVFNFAGISAWPLVLGIFGRPGDGKSFQVRTHIERRGALAVSINAADLESDRAGQPGKLVLAKYEDAGHRTSEGTPAVRIVDDFDTTVGEWEKSTSTVNHQQVLAQLMHLADSPTQGADRTLRRVPVFVTGNDLSKVYAPLRRPGRMRPFFWRPTEAERQEIVERSDFPNAIRHSRSVRGSTTSHHAIAAGRWEARGWGWPYFSQPIFAADRSLFSPTPSPLVPRQWAQSANSLEKWRARQDSNLRPPA